MIRLASIAPTSISRSGRVSGVEMLVTQLVQFQASDTASNDSGVSLAPLSVRPPTRREAA